MLSNNPGNTPMPPSLQAKMMAVRLSLLPRSPFISPLQMLNRGSPSPAPPPDPERDDVQRTHTSFPRSAPRRNKPGLKLSDIPDAAIAAANAGLGAGRPSLANPGRRAPSTFDTPFANFNKIVYVAPSLHPFPAHA